MDDDELIGTPTVEEDECFLLCSNCLTPYNPREDGWLDGQPPLYCDPCSPTIKARAKAAGTLALICRRTTKFNRSDFNSSTKQRYDEIVRFGGKVFVMLDWEGEYNGVVFDWEDLNQPKYFDLSAWMQAMTDEGRVIEYGWRW
jgi:hypothetical protein